MHFKYPDLVCCSKTVLDSTKQAICMITFTLEIQHSIGDMFESFWASYGAFFRDMSNDKDRYVGAFCQLHKLECAFTHLADAARRRRDVTRYYCLDRINNH